MTKFARYHIIATNLAAQMRKLPPRTPERAIWRDLAYAAFCLRDEEIR